MREIKLIALDLDGTLLNSKKELSAANRAALKRAADAGIEIVPTTGRFYGGMPEAIRNLDFINYAITVNGAQVYDIKNDRAIARAEIPLAYALEIMEYMDTKPVIYDCYQDNWGYMTRSMWEAVENFTPDPHYRVMVRELRKPVPELKAYLKEKGRDIQKTQLFTCDAKLREQLLNEMPLLFPKTAVSSAAPNNVEINDKKAHKGNAIGRLAAFLGFGLSECAGFGDGLNDISMIRECGVGIAMANACSGALAVCDHVTVSNDEDGVARGVEFLGI